MQKNIQTKKNKETNYKIEIIMMKGKQKVITQVRDGNRKKKARKSRKDIKIKK